jgi:hypothetical protein
MALPDQGHPAAIRAATTALKDTLKQYRSDGKQKIVVKHVTVNEGGQASVGDVTHGGPGGGMSENPEATP